MKSRIRITAKDADGNAIDIRASLKMPTATFSHHREYATKMLVRKIAAAIEGVSYTDFGVDNVSVESTP